MIIKENDYRELQHLLNANSYNSAEFEGCLFVFDKGFEKWYNGITGRAHPLKEWLKILNKRRVDKKYKGNKK